MTIDPAIAMQTTATVAMTTEEVVPMHRQQHPRALWLTLALAEATIRRRRRLLPMHLQLIRTTPVTAMVLLLLLLLLPHLTETLETPTHHHLLLVTHAITVTLILLGLIRRHPPPAIPLRAIIFLHQLLRRLAITTLAMTMVVADAQKIPDEIFAVMTAGHLLLRDLHTQMYVVLCLLHERRRILTTTATLQRYDDRRK